MKLSFMLLGLLVVGAVLADVRNPPMGLKGTPITQNIKALPNPRAGRRIGVEGIPLPKGVNRGQLYIVRSNETNIPMAVGIKPLPTNIKGAQPQGVTPQPIGWTVPPPYPANNNYNRIGWNYPGPNIQ